MIDRGWRRSGAYVYLPDRLLTCCPPYTIRSSASDFRPSRSQRQTVNRSKHFFAPQTSHPTNNHPPTFDLVKIFESFERPSADPEHPRFEIKLEPAGFSQQKFELYRKYQTKVHNEEPEKVTEEAFRRFLCDHPFRSDPSVAWHASWIRAGSLLAFSVLDILPNGISSVYFVWDPDFAHLGLGTLSVLREIAWIQEWRSRRFSSLFNWYYLGFYIHSCAKMKYKAGYSPSFLLDPTTLKWEPLEQCIPLLEGRERVMRSVDSVKQPTEFFVKVLNQVGEIEHVKSNSPRVAELVEKLGREVLEDCLMLC